MIILIGIFVLFSFVFIYFKNEDKLKISNLKEFMPKTKREWFKFILDVFILIIFVYMIFLHMKSYEQGFMDCAKQCPIPKPVLFNVTRG